jgi:predicted ATPase/DNA-binding SARP family transcriptional activator/Flp pilus assembly protein TadD
MSQSTIEPASKLHIRLFGPFGVTINGHPMRALRTRKGQWLLSLLALRMGKPVEREWLSAVLWPDSDETQALSGLRRALTDLRSALGNQDWRLDAPTPRTLQLSLDGADYDVAAFDSAIRSDDPDRLLAAIELHTGPLLEGCAEEWVQAERAPRQEACIQAMERVSDQAIARGDFDLALRCLRQAASLEPWREPAIRLLMRAQAGAGDYAGMALTYRDLRLALREELNSDPSEETKALFQELRQRGRETTERVSETSPNPPSPSPTIAEPIEASPMGASAPAPLASIIGRDRDLQQSIAILRGVRLLTLTGPGGVGKTRLAVQLAREMASSYAAGVAFTDLSGIKDGNLVDTLLAQAVGVSSTKEGSLWLAANRHLGSRTALVVLDNCEHLIHDCARAVGECLGACPGVTVLATSRQPLGVSGETVLRIQPLDTPSRKGHAPKAPDPIAAARSYDSVRLFVERAQSASPGFALDERNVDAVVDICRRLDGLPLAIELAAARVRAMPPAQIAQRLGDRFRLFGARDRSHDPRRSLLGTLNWSWDLLTDEERTLLRRLSVFSGGWTLQSAEAVCASDEERDGLQVYDIADILASLVDRSLVVLDTRDPEGRYRLLETVREFSRERLIELEELDEMSSRQAAYFESVVKNGEESKGKEYTAWLTRLDRERDNVRVALAWILDPDRRLELASALSKWWTGRGYGSEARAWLEGAIARHTGKPTKLLGRAMRCAGNQSYYQADYPATRHWYSEALRVSRETADERGTAVTLCNLGMLDYELGELEQAERTLRESIALSEQMGNLGGVTTALINLGAILEALMRYDECRATFERSLKLDRETGDRLGEATSLSNLGVVSVRQGDLDAAHSFFCQARELASEFGQISAIAYVEHGLGMVALRRGNLAEARSRFAEALRIRREGDYWRGIADCLEELGGLHACLGNHERAAFVWGAAEALRDRIGAPMSKSEEGGVAPWQTMSRSALGAEFDQHKGLGAQAPIEELLDQEMAANASI